MIRLIDALLLKEIDFPNQKSFDAYAKKHKLRPDTKVKIAGKLTTAGKAAQQSGDIKGKNVFGKDKGEKVFSDKSNQTEPSDELVKGITSTSGGGRVITLYRKNKNGKIVRDLDFKQTDITSDMIKKVIDTEGIDLNLLNKLGPDTKIKNEEGKSEPVKDIIRGLVFRSLEANQYAPDGANPDDRLYKIYTDSKDQVVKAIKKEIQPKENPKEKEKPKDKKPGKEKIEYKSEEVSKITNVLSSMKDSGAAFEYTPNQADILKVANKYKIDVNRILSNPERYSEIAGPSYDKKESAKEYALRALGHTISVVRYSRYGEQEFLDMAWKLKDLQMAFPLKYKQLSDKEWQNKVAEEYDNPTMVASALEKFTKDEKTNTQNIDKIDNDNRKTQKEWVKKQSKNKNYSINMMSYQQDINKFALNKIDELLKSDPPPPIKSNALYRGMAMKSADLKKFLKTFSEGSDIELPISSFSIDASVATGFANNLNNSNTLINKANNQCVLIKVTNKNNTFNGFAMNSNIKNAKAPGGDRAWEADFDDWDFQQEVLLPSNNKYKVIKTETKKMENNRTFTVIELEMIGAKNEQVIKLKELMEDESMDILKKHLQYPNRISLVIP